MFRREDQAGTVVEEWQSDVEELSPVSASLEGQPGRVVPVHLHTRVTEVGQLEISCQSRDGKESWKLEYSVRERAEE